MGGDGAGDEGLEFVAVVLELLDGEFGGVFDGENAVALGDFEEEGGEQ